MTAFSQQRPCDALTGERNTVIEPPGCGRYLHCNVCEGRNSMKMFAAAAAALCAITWAGAASAEGAAKLCDKPRQMEGFKSCADVAKAEAEGNFVLYSTDPEQGQVKLLASFNKMFPKIKTSYVRLQ